MSEYTYAGNVLTIVSYAPLTVDVKLHLRADVGFDMVVYFGMIEKRMRVLGCDNIATEKRDNFPTHDVVNLLLNRNLEIVTHKGMRNDEYACDLIDVHGNNIADELKKLGIYR